MFDIADSKTFMDVVHGYIQIPRCFVDNIIDTLYFQRLRNIDQTGMRTLYPDAKHDRYGHSLGVYHLGNKAVNALLDNFSHEKYWYIRSDHTRDNFWAKNKVLFLIACLLHDIGHAPYSHALEIDLLANSGADNSFRPKVIDMINDLEKPEQDYHIKLSDINASPHELIGARLIIDKLKPNVFKILDYLKSKNYPLHDEPSLYAEHYRPAPPIDGLEIDNDICFIARMILGLKYKSFEPEMQIKNCFIELLNGGNFDVDKLDYIMRDTKMSGISNIGIDVERLISSISIVTQTKYDVLMKDTVVKFVDQTLLHRIRSKDIDFTKTIKVKGNIYGTFILNSGSTVQISKGSKFELLSQYSVGNLEKTPKIKLLKPVIFSHPTEVIEDGIPLQTSQEDTEIVLSHNIHSPFKVSVKNAFVKSDGGFLFTIEDTGSAFILKTNGYCEFSIKGSFINDTPISTDNFEIDGEDYEMTVLGDKLIQGIPKNDVYNTFSVGFKKQAINIIANVLDARDYLYRWIYAHHKVMYYANFLIPVISNSIFSNVVNDTFPSWAFNYDNIEYLDDAYIFTTIKHIYSKFPDLLDERIKFLVEELLNRKYKKSLFKSLAEYDLIFDSFSIEQKLEIHHIFENNLNSENRVVQSDSQASAGFVTTEFLNELKMEDDNIDGIQELVWVDASYRRRINDPRTTYLIFPSGPTTLGKIDLLNNPLEIANKNTSHYFYLYYSSRSGNDSEAEYLRRSIAHYFNKKFK